MELSQFFISAIHNPRVPLPEIRSVLEEAFGPLDESSRSYPFDQTDYYAKEMGSGLVRVFFPLRKIIPPSELVRFKKMTVEVESAFFTIDRRRSVNLDPGYLDAVKVVLASTKGGGHKIPLTSEIFADLVLDYFKGAFRPFDWTFPDFKSTLFHPFLVSLRENYLRKIPLVAL